jgi:hypothetical protein
MCVQEVVALGGSALVVLGVAANSGLAAISDIEAQCKAIEDSDALTEGASLVAWRLGM